MKLYRWMKRGDKGGLSVVSLFLILIILCVFFIFSNFANLYINSTALESKMQSSVTSALEFAMMDNYRADGTLKLDRNIAETTLNKFLTEDLGVGYSKSEKGKPVYKVNISSTEIAEEPPSIRIRGTITFTLPFVPFGINNTTSRNFDITSHEASLLPE